MKKIIVVSFLLIAVILVAGCIRSSKLNAEHCKTINNSTERLGCYDSFNYDLTEAICDSEKVQPLQNLCYAKFAEYNEHNLSVCDKINGAVQKLRCYTAYEYLDNASLNPTLCEKVENLSGRGHLLYECYLKVSSKTGNKSLCDKISIKYERERCQEGEPPFIPV